MDKKTQIVILCEDLQQEVFARSFLVKCGINIHRIRSVIGPKGKGAAEAFVRKQYPREVAAYRRRKHAINIALVVMIDADTRPVQSRYTELDEHLTQASLAKRQPDDQIGIFVPKRNIETWIYHLKGASVNEEDVYDHLERESECKPLVEELALKRRQPLPENAPASLQMACKEVERVLVGKE